MDGMTIYIASHTADTCKCIKIEQEEDSRSSGEDREEVGLDKRGHPTGSRKMASRFAIEILGRLNCLRVCTNLS